jgi:hypothetical protein
MKENNSDRAVDMVGRPNFKGGKSFGSSSGSSKKSSPGESAKGIGGGLKDDNTVDEPIFHEAAYRSSGKDANYEKKPESGLPRQESSYQNRDRQGSGLEAEPVYQKKFPAYPSKGSKTKQSSDEDD